ncbi:MAG: CvpA family protein [Candidatus Anstonellales archaeon]
MSYIDLILIGVIAFILWLDYKQGFLRAILGLVGNMVSYLVARYNADKLANYVYEKYNVEKKIHDIAYEMVKSSLGEVGLKSKISINGDEFNRVVGLLEKLVKVDITNNAKVGLMRLKGLFEVGMSYTMNYIVDGVVKVLRPAVMTLLVAMSFVALFIIVSVVCDIIIQITVKFIHGFKLLKKMDNLAGLCVGAIKVIVVMVFVSPYLNMIIVVNNMITNKPVSSLVITWFVKLNSLIM